MTYPLMTSHKSGEDNIGSLVRDTTLSPWRPVLPRKHLCQSHPLSKWRVIQLSWTNTQSTKEGHILSKYFMVEQSSVSPGHVPQHTLPRQYRQGGPRCYNRHLEYCATISTYIRMYWPQWRAASGMKWHVTWAITVTDVQVSQHATVEFMYVLYALHYIIHYNFFSAGVCAPDFMSPLYTRTPTWFKIGTICLA